ncbi:MAG: OmpH family outer membrane protein [Alistipes sp.]|nr:OmpH family outer membrane protein [Alistipes sp.]MBR3886561.1 OmpH family outer membrane protein [Alistipes sp.]
MKKYFFTLLVAALSFAACDNKTATPAAEGEAAATETVTGGDVAYVRVEYVLAESEIYKTEGVALQEKTQKAQNSWAQKEQNLQYEAVQLQEKYQKGLITTADAQKQQESIEKKISNYQTSAQKEAETLDEENYVFSNRTQDLILRAIQSINADKKYKMVVNSTALLDADPALDISDAVLAKVNELYAAEKNEKK